jgi:asparagine synthetase B (glutamine-hydrolysing)
MSASRAGARITLTQWVAGFVHDAPEREPSSPAPAKRVGPLDIIDAEGDLERCCFGQRAASVALFHGFIFDRDDLCADLELPLTASGAEVVAAAYQQWGMQFLTRVAGSYLVAIWDAARRRLFVAHDPLGHHPVFYSRGQRATWFSANVLALAASGMASNRPNRLSLLFAAITLWPEAGDTFFADIRRLRVGSYLEISSDGTTTERQYWNPLPETDSEYLSEREVLDGFEPGLIRAVDRCMQFAPDGIMLSGGVDSVTIAALATRCGRTHGQPPLVAFSGRPDTPLLQEEQMQTRAAEALGLPHIITHTSEWTRHRNDIEVSLEVTPELPGPSRIYWVGTYMGFYRTAAAHGLHVLLTGSGGDNWLSVADTHAADLIRGLRVTQLANLVMAAARTGGAGYAAAMKKVFWHGGLRPLVDSCAAVVAPGRKHAFHRARAEAMMPPWLCPDGNLRREFLDRWLQRRTPALDRNGRFPRSYYLQAVGGVDNPHLYHEFEVAFHVDAACGLRLLSPYHDADLVRFFTRIPPALLLHDGKYKGLLRPLVEKYVPGLGFGQQRKHYPKHAFDIDLANLRAGVSKAWPAFDFAALRRLDLVDSSVVAHEAERVASHPFVPLVRMFALMSAETWTAGHTA